MHFFRLLLLPLLFVVITHVQAAGHAQPDWSNWVVKVDVIQRNGTTEMGSGVILSPQRVVTNCHVVRNARTIRLSHGSESWEATLESGDEYRDLCFLVVARPIGNPPAMGGAENIRVSIPVYAVGYSNGKFRASSGNIKGLYLCACDGGRVIRVSAPFDPGASGGGLFDAAGRLLGILTFKSVAGGEFHFAVPIGWMKMLGKTVAGNGSGKGTFWENIAASSNYFLVACDLRARKDWKGLLKVTLDWTRQEPDNPEAWMSLGRAQLNQGQKEAAAKDFQEVLQLDSTHAEASWELQKLELDLDRTLTH
jgi:serine protease Do